MSAVWCAGGRVAGGDRGEPVAVEGERVDGPVCGVGLDDGGSGGVDEFGGCGAEVEGGTGAVFGGGGEGPTDQAVPSLGVWLGVVVV